MAQQSLEPLFWRRQFFSSLLQGIVPGAVGGSVPFITSGGYWISAFGGMSGVGLWPVWFHLDEINL